MEKNFFISFSNGYNSKYLEIQKTLEQNDLKSLNRYLNTQNLEQQEIHGKVSNEYETCEWITIIIALRLGAFLFKKIIDHIKRNPSSEKIYRDSNQI